MAVALNKWDTQPEGGGRGARERKGRRGRVDCRQLIDTLQISCHWRLESVWSIPLMPLIPFLLDVRMTGAASSHSQAKYTNNTAAPPSTFFFFSNLKSITSSLLTCHFMEKQSNASREPYITKKMSNQAFQFPLFSFFFFTCHQVDHFGITTRLEKKAWSSSFLSVFLRRWAEGQLIEKRQCVCG